MNEATGLYHDPLTHYIDYCEAANNAFVHWPFVQYNIAYTNKSCKK